MIRARPYSVQFHNVSVSAVQDLIALYSGASMASELHGVVIGQVTGTSVANLAISVKRLPASVTAGSGGAAATPQKINRGDGAATATARTNDTSQATTGGTAAVLHADVFNTVNGYQFFWPPADVPTIGPSEATIMSPRHRAWQRDDDERDALLRRTALIAPLERVTELVDVAGWYGRRQAAGVARLRRQMQGAEQQVPRGELGGEVLVADVAAMMPAMKLRTNHEIAQRP